MVSFWIQKGKFVIENVEKSKFHSLFLTKYDKSLVEIPLKPIN